MYFNDDGVTLDKTDFNQYHFTYSQPNGVNPASLTLDLSNKQIKNPSKNEGAINANDHLSTLEIYNAAAYGMDNASGYTVRATMEDGSSKTLVDASYVSESDRLVYTAPGSGLVLPQLNALVFSRKA